MAFLHDGDHAVACMYHDVQYNSCAEMVHGCLEHSSCGNFARWRRLSYFIATAEATLAGSEDFAGKRARSAVGMLWYIGFSSLNTGKSLAIATQEQL